MNPDMILWSAMSFVRETLFRGNTSVAIDDLSRKGAFVRVVPEPHRGQTYVYFQQGHLSCVALWPNRAADASLITWEWSVEGAATLRLSGAMMDGHPSIESEKPNGS